MLKQLFTFRSCWWRLCCAAGLDCRDGPVARFIGCVDSEMILCRLAQLVHFVRLTGALVYCLEAARNTTVHTIITFRVRHS